MITTVIFFRITVYVQCLCSLLLSHDSTRSSSSVNLMRPPKLYCYKITNRFLMLFVGLINYQTHFIGDQITLVFDDSVTQSKRVRGAFKKFVDWHQLTTRYVHSHIGVNHWGSGGSGSPQNLDGPPTFYVAFWWIECDYVTNCTKLGRPVWLFFSVEIEG